MNDKEAPKNRIFTTIFIIALLCCSFLLGRAYGFEEAKDAYEPVLQKSQELIDELESEIQEFYAYFEGAPSPSNYVRHTLK